MGTPQGVILSPLLLANIALSVLDDPFAEAWERDIIPDPSGPPAATMEEPRIVSCDMPTTSCCVVAGTGAHAKELRGEGCSGARSSGLLHCLNTRR